MKILYYDCFSGISGDMNLGALIDLGVDQNYLIDELSKLNIDEEFELEIKPGMKNGISGTKVDVIVKGDPRRDGHDHAHGHHRPHDHEHDHGHHHTHDHDHDHGNHHTHDHDHGHQHSHDNDHDHEHHHTHDHDHDHGHHHTHDHDHSHGHGHHHHHDRNYKIIKEMIESSDLSDAVKKLSIDMFYEIAVAEAKVHGKTVDEVHFHEVGAVDSIVDIVGAAVCIDALKVDKIMASTVQLGGGFVMCDHGKIPVPAPATSEILKGIPVKTGLVQFETTTPTGAAILKANVDQYTDSHDFVIEKMGYGLGTKTFEVPNVLRVYLGEATDKSDADDHFTTEYEQMKKASQYLLETNIDDMSSELYAYVEEKLFESGALDVYKTPIIMKKGRPAVKLSVLIRDKDREAVLGVIFKETTSGGVREYPVTKHMMKKQYRKVETKFGVIQVKDFYHNDECLKSKPEYEDCANAAREYGVSIKEVYNAVWDAENRG